MKSFLLASVSASVLVAGPAHAQTSSAPTSSPPTQAAPAPAPSGDDIVVTAQRRTERLTDVPASIIALPQETLVRSGVTATPDLARVTPGLTMNFYGGFLQPSIRGVTSTGANLGESSNVASYIDGVYQPQQIATLFELPDVQRVEVLKGPQGALYGQNATGGAILVTTEAPSFTPTGRLSASYGNYNNVDLRGYLSGPLSDTLAVSIAGGYHDHEGYRRQVVTGQRDRGLDSKVVRGKVLFQPSTAVRLTLSGYYSDIVNSAMYAGFAYNNNTITNLPDLSAVFGAPAGTFRTPAVARPTRADQFSTTPDVFTRVKSWGTNLRGEVDTGAGTITGVIAYLDNKASYRADVDGSAVDFAEAFTNALPGHYVVADANFASKQFSRVSFLAGAFLLSGSEEFQFNSFSLLAPSAPPAAKTVLFTSNQFGRLEKRIVAGYAEVTVEPIDRLFLTAGGRYTDEQQRGFSDFGTGKTVAYPGNPINFDKFTPRVTLRYALRPDANVYASWSKGFKSGGINLAAFAIPPYRPENLTSYEIGFKGRIAPSLTANLAGFYYDYSDLQVVQYVPPNYVEENAAAARLFGADFDLSWRPARNLTLTAGGTFLDSRYTRASVTSYVPTGFGNVPTPGADVSGNQLLRAPGFSGNASANYEAAIGAGRIGAYASVYHSAGYPFEIANRIRQKPYTTLDAQISFAPAALPRLRVVLWGKNIGNEVYLASLLQSQFADVASYAEPRTYGVRLEFAF